MNEEIDTIFIPTKEYRRFAEFCEACRKFKYIGLCYGSPGVGKTLSARHYSQWHFIEDYNKTRWKNKPAFEARFCRTVFYTAPVTSNPRTIEAEVRRLIYELKYTVEDSLSKRDAKKLLDANSLNELMIVDEADRLKLQGLEQLRDHFDRYSMGLILMGMPGLEKRLARYPQLYSRVGFVHEFKPLSKEEVSFILENRWKDFGLDFDLNDFTDNEALAAVVRITQGNLRLIHRLLAQAQRIMEINSLKFLSMEVLETARDSLVIGKD